MSKVEVSERVMIAGAFNGTGGNMLNVDVKLTFDIPPKMFTPGMSQLVMHELHNSVVRLLEQAKKEKG